MINWDSVNWAQATIAIVSALALVLSIGTLVLGLYNYRQIKNKPRDDRQRELRENLRHYLYSMTLAIRSSLNTPQDHDIWRENVLNKIELHNELLRKVIRKGILAPSPQSIEHIQALNSNLRRYEDQYPLAQYAGFLLQDIDALIDETNEIDNRK
ncbi:hypothetical protein P5V96_21490 [Mycobacteroides abscessus subsp. abscessus]|uniref:hypothetical protein n=1 Tax=Mycobacteroides abscessus TaxID=36809 RepID=UPI000927BAD2|nr:hypothetical protein [Mycobacteroides abscessus]MDO3015306.1 hypothetical protein [Mycobacteroides abscessus subsp. abscessus]MDO3085859.1 hypothetical protein [Mycobacteroides abscessus subsp. abscessus]MDO3315770.1 hypothetical protein [Mycobacteroides abscessus subsp. abscessus]MDO3343049.1 hypothetical protein [Mycobacteroides abscessus subsp. abscessus]SHQ37880.1 Uncharacterised protein [Mycobacteroides abscessus subsp. abscessus]